MTDTQHELHLFMAQVADEIASEYQRIVARAAEDPGTAGDEGEENWANLLRDWLPPNYHVVTKGRLLGVNGETSPQVDVLVLKPFYPNKLREKKIWLAEGVAAAFECKITLRSEHLRDAANRSRQCKSLLTPRVGSPEKELRSSLLYGVLAHSHAWKGPNSKPDDNVERALDAGISSAQHPASLIDLVCLADVGTWTCAAITKHPAAWETRYDLSQRFGGSWGVSTNFAGAVKGRTAQSNSFQPIGAMVNYLTRRLAWEDKSLRDLADYYQAVDMRGSLRGTMSYWPQSVYSDALRSDLEVRALDNSKRWDEWAMTLL
jgi:hypothetical protein